MKKHKGNQDPGPNPGPGKYTLVKNKERWYWRRIRGSVKPAILNEVCSKSAESTKLCSPAARRMVAALQQHLHGLQTGRLTVRINGALKKAYHQKGALDFSFLEGYDFQADHPLEELLKVSPTCMVKKGIVQVQIPIDSFTVKKHNQLVSEYYFDLIVLHGDAAIEQNLQVEHVTSPLYPFKPGKKSVCTLQLPLPENDGPWMALLKVSCLEGDEVAHHQRHYGMKVLKQGSAVY